MYICIYINCTLSCFFSESGLLLDMLPGCVAQKCVPLVLRLIGG